MIIKPTVGMGSSGVYKVSTYEELETQVSRLLNDIDTNWALAQNRVGNQAPILAETFVDPVTFGDVDLVTEFDIDCTFWDGKLMYANVIDNWFPEPPYFQDRGFHAPSLTPESIQKELIDYSAAAVKAMGFERGNFHMECWYTKTGPILIECNPRVGGGSIDMTHQQIWGVSPTLNMILAFMDIPVNPPREIKPKCSYGFMLINARESGVIGEKSYVLDAETHKMVELAAPFKKAGDEVKGLDVGVPEWLAQVDFKTSAPTY
uniref:ATP-grasp domain-containing protein n=2 Tax=Prorocentrum micans TaxID=2945 RepID=A0A7S2X3X4_PROMC|mmetsp:Transcript_13940/g.11222  ORF Transcript_13940/g.11222 Transcript_13940/m.11222 type:complete len:262 (+) Transcript_13940:207-992(+)